MTSSGPARDRPPTRSRAAIADCIVRPRAEVYPFPKAWWLAVLSVIAPAQADTVVQQFGRRRKPIARTRG